MKVLLLYPEFPDTFWSFKHALKFIRRRASLPPLGLLTVAAMLPEGWAKRLVDVNVRKLREKDLAWAEVVFISGMIAQQDSRSSRRPSNSKDRTIPARSVRAMINQATQPPNEENPLARLAGLYPLAFALAAASNSRAGLAWQRFEIAGLNSSRRCVDQPLKSTLQSSGQGYAHTVRPVHSARPTRFPAGFPPRGITFAA